MTDTNCSQAGTHLPLTVMVCRCPERPAVPEVPRHPGVWLIGSGCLLGLLTVAKE